MMRLVRTMSNCTGVKCVEGHLLQAINGEVIVDDLKTICVESVDLILLFQGNLNYCLDFTLFEIDRESVHESVLISVDGADSLSRLTKNLFLIHNRLSRKELKYSIIDESKNVLWEVVGNRFIKAVLGRLLVFNRLSKEEFWVLDTSGIELFHYKLPLGFNVYRNIEVINDTLFFMSNKEANNFMNVTGVDFSTGKVKWNYEYSIPYETNFIATTLYKNLTYGLSNRFYQVFDPETGEFLVNLNIENILPAGIFPEVNRQNVADRRLWFVSGRGNDVSFGAFNIDMSKIDFIVRFPLSEEDQFDTPVYYKGRLYLRTLHSNTLHIFEKE